MNPVLGLVLADLAAVVLGTATWVATAAMVRPTLPFGVRVAAARVADPAVVAARRSFTRAAVAVGVLTAVVSVPLVLVTANAAVVAGALAVVLFAGLTLYYRAYRRVLAAKRDGGWAGEHRQGVTVDTSFRAEPVRVPWPWLVPGVLVAVGTAVAGGPAGTVLYQAGTVVVAAVLSLLLVRARPDLDAARPRGSARRYRVYLRGVARLVLLLATAVNLTLVAALLPAGWPRTVAAVLPLAALAVVFLVWERRVGQAGHRLPAEPGEDDEDSGVVQRDDDRHWLLAGMVYLNRRDPALLVHRRVGVYWTLNLGHPVAWVLLAVIAVVAVLALTGAVDLPERHNLF
ncbi:DUF1648 domain-containing protein [Amycolatopsis suaedae]|uniref:DUF5808 domain-containing protein n=1 Tax=Amycolatopsis suaedae TaxID=2510978 RepID=A0A4Q7J611_9PSEU|nr:DUF5808 domain-containing protein [Amycolatopsis suaedae]RZQ63040.1 hypothetical protein EWH70_15230 [Amycolatopsis suaedae]